MGCEVSSKARLLPDPAPLPSSKFRINQLLDALDDRVYSCHLDREVYDRARLGLDTTKTMHLNALGKPIAIATCTSTKEVATALKYHAKHCAKHDIPICVAGGRHSHLCMVSGAFAIDLSGMKAINVNAVSQWVDVEGGARWGDVIKATKAHNLAVTSALLPSAGVGGHTLSGGHGVLERAFGMAIDNLHEVEIVTAKGDILLADEKKHPELFWAVRGGNGNFGVVTRFRFALHKLPKLVFAGRRIHAPLGTNLFPDRDHLIRRFLEVTVGSKNELSCGMMLLRSGGSVVEVPIYVGDAKEGEAFYEDHRKMVGRPVRDTMKARSYSEVIKSAPMPGGRPGNYYIVGIKTKAMQMGLAEAISEIASKKNHPGSGTNCCIFLVPGGGRSSHVDASATAYAHRDLDLSIIIQGEWSGKLGTKGYADRRARSMEWIRNAQNMLEPYRMGYGGRNKGGYDEKLDNGMKRQEMTKTESGDDTVPLDKLNGLVQREMMSISIYGKNLRRLQSIKEKYDPRNVFRLNDNILPKPENWGSV